MSKISIVLPLFLIACGATTTPDSGDPTKVPGYGQVADGGLLLDGRLPEEAGTAGVGPTAGTAGAPTDGSVLPDAMTLPGTDAMVDSGPNPTDSGSDAEVDSGLDATTQNPDCTLGTKCDGLTVLECVSGMWVTKDICDFVCDDGVCSGVCEPGDRDCSGEVPRHCNSTGLWVPEDACDFVCGGEGVCSGSCSPGATQCSDLTVQTCDTNGTWTSAASPCPFACSTGACSGVCVSGDRDCSSDVPRHCNANGQWVNETACSFVCLGEGVCSGSCDPGAVSCSGDTPRSCNSAGAWVNGSTCPFMCSAGSCTGVCEPSDRDCSGLTPRNCNSNGQWVNEAACSFICGGEGVCSGSCLPGAMSCSGDVPRTCNGSGSWVNGSTCPFACNAGACTVCEPGATQCSGSQIQTCNASGQWGTAANCGSVAGAVPYCSAGACTFDCALDFDDCDGNPANGCEINIDSDANNCGSCGHSCCGGTCGSGSCDADTLFTANTFAVTPEADTLYYTLADGVHEFNVETLSSTLFAARETAQSAPTDIATNGARVAWGERNATTSSAIVFSKTLAGSGQRTEGECLTCTVYPAHLTYDSTNLYWQFDTSNSANGFSSTPIQYNPTANPNPNPLSSYTVYATETGGGNAFSKVSEFVSDGTYLYARLYNDAGHPDEMVHRALPTNAAGNNDVAFTSFAGTNPSISSPVTDGTFLYYLVYEYSGSPTLPNIGIWKKPLVGGGTAVQITASATITPHIATDGVNVYFVDSAGAQLRLRKVPVVGGSAVTLAFPTGTLNRIRVANECVFWQSGSSVSGVAANP